MSSASDLTRRVVRDGRVVTVRTIGRVEAQPARPPMRKAHGFAPRHREELVAAAKALHEIGLGPTRIAELLKIPDSHEAVKWWTRGLCRRRVRMSAELYETVVSAIEASIR
jgi:hypothetical protein